MNVLELIEALGSLPPDAKVTYLWDGAPGSTVVHAYLARSGDVVLADDCEPVFLVVDRPVGAQAGERWLPTGARADEGWLTSDLTDKP